MKTFFFEILLLISSKIAVLIEFHLWGHSRMSLSLFYCRYQNVTVSLLRSPPNLLLTLHDFCSVCVLHCHLCAVLFSTIQDLHFPACVSLHQNILQTFCIHIFIIEFLIFWDQLRLFIFAFAAMVPLTTKKLKQRGFILNPPCNTTEKWQSSTSCFSYLLAVRVCHCYCLYSSWDFSHLWSEHFSSSSTLFYFINICILF